MSQMLQGCPWFAVPQHVIRSGVWHDLKPGEKGLYITLLHESERYSTRQLAPRLDRNLSELSGVSPRSLRDARIKLQERGLIQFTPSQHGYIYTICDPRTGFPFPGSPKERIAPRLTSVVTNEEKNEISNAAEVNIPHIDFS